MLYQPLEQFELEVFSNTIKVGSDTLFKSKTFVNIVNRWMNEDSMYIIRESTFNSDSNLNHEIFFISSSIFVYTFFILFLIFFFFSFEFVSFKNKRRENIIGFIFKIKENLYFFVFKMLKEQINDSREIQKFFPFLFAIFTFILFANFLGLIPFNFTVTSHLLVTFNLSFMVFIGITIIGILINKEKFILLFIPANVPKYLLDFLFIIELVSYISRTFSLAIRLFANMLSGHALMFILSGFISKTYKVFNFAFELRFLIIFVVMAVSVLEMGICFLQAYVFTILTIIYLNDSFNVSH